MSKCLNCGKKGMFLKTSKRSLCNRCEHTVVPYVKRDLEILDDSIRLINESKNFDTRMGRIGTAVDVCNRLKEYWDKGIQFFKPNPYFTIEKLEEERPKIIDEEIKKRVRKHLNKADTMKTNKAKYNNANKGLDELSIFEREYNYMNKELKNEVENYISNIK